MIGSVVGGGSGQLYKTEVLTNRIQYLRVNITRVELNSETPNCGNPLQYSCLENPMDRGDWQATVHGVTRVRYDFAFKHTTTEVKKFHVDEGNPHRHPLDLGAEFFYIFTYFYSI